MTLKNLTKTASLAVAAGSLFLSASVLSANAGPGMGSNLGECYNNWINWCNDHTSGYPNSCYTNSLKKCDQTHKARSSAIPQDQLQAMKNASLRKAKQVKAAMVPTGSAPR